MKKREKSWTGSVNAGVKSLLTTSRQLQIGWATPRGHGQATRGQARPGLAWPSLARPGLAWPRDGSFRMLVCLRRPFPPST